MLAKELPEHGIYAIDCHYVEPQVAAAYLVVEGDEAAFVENNTTHAVPKLLEALQEKGLSPEAVKYLIITHVHLDHAGGTSALLKACPNATVLAHPRAAKHVIDPSRLVESSKLVYGEAKFGELYGEIGTVDEARVRSPEDGEEIALGGRKFRFIYTRGHANHHFCIYDSKSNGIFTGDTFGLAYPTLQDGSRPFLFASTTPTDFHADEAKLSLQKIADTGAEHAFLTHFGIWSDMQEGQKQMHHALDAMTAIYDEAISSSASGADLNDECAAKVKDYLLGELTERGYKEGDERLELLALDAELNGMGLAFAAEKERRKRQG